MAIEVFNRYENKYMLESQIAFQLQRKLSEHMQLDDYNKAHETYTVTNLYYDTADSYLICSSMAKPHYKEKLRLRAYGVPTQDSLVFAEVKKKVFGLVNKRRTELKLDEAYAFLLSGLMPAPQPYQNRQVMGEIAYMLKAHDLKPVVYLAYDRKAYFDSDGCDLRISFDCKIRTRRHDLRLEAGDCGTPIIKADQCLMEIKSAHSLPLWLCHLLSENAIYPIGFSKYSTEYLGMLATKNDAKTIYNLTPSYAAQMPRAAVGA